MKKKVLVLTLVLTIAIIGVSIFMLVTVSAEATIQSKCEQVVLDFTKGEPVEFVKKIGTGEKSLAWEDLYPGFYDYKDDIYHYIVDPNNLYLYGIYKIPGAAWDRANESKGRIIIKEEAINIAVEMSKKVMAKFLIQKGNLEAHCTSPEETGYYNVDIVETFNNIPTGNQTSIAISSSGTIGFAFFHKGDDENIEKLINEQNKMISEETAQQIALEKVKSMATELEAENIQIDDSEPCEMMTLEDTTVWAVPFTYTKQGVDYACGGIVNVEVFSGEVYDVRMYA